MKFSCSYTVLSVLFILVSLMMLPGCTDGIFVDEDRAADRPHDYGH